MVSMTFVPAGLFGGVEIALTFGFFFLAMWMYQWQGQRVPRWRIAAAVLLIAAVSFSFLRADTVLPACYGVERYSAEWWILGCWYLDLAR